MPGGDRTGPMGMGAMTGRAAGWCAGSSMPGFSTSPSRRWGGVGFGRGRGGGIGFGGSRRGRRNMFYATGLPGYMRRGDYAADYGYPGVYQQPDPQMERQMLKDQAEALQAELDMIKKRLSEVEAKNDPGD